ncbi:MAG: ABC transporter permease [Chloroflexi bacterium]|nr:ABC transporter permease [Chloroflexota bacterium]
MAHAEVSTPISSALPARGPRSQTWKRLRTLFRGGPGLLGFCIVLIVVLGALLADFIAPYDPLAQNIPRRLSPPSWSFEPGSYLLGTDPLGRDILSRIIYGAQISLIIAVCSVLLAGTVGIIIGVLAGYYGGRLDLVLMRIVDTWLAIPFLVLAIAIVAVLGANLQNIIFVLALTGWVTYCRVARAEVLSVREEMYVDSARVVGASDPRIMLRYILPNVATSLIVVATLQVAQMITAEAALSFLGLSVQPPTPAWGSMVAEGKDVISLAWWLSAFPGLAIVVTVLGINLLGDWLRDVLDPRLRI